MSANIAEVSIQSKNIDTILGQFNNLELSGTESATIYSPRPPLVPGSNHSSDVTLSSNSMDFFLEKWMPSFKQN